MPIAIASTLLNFIPRLIISVALSSVILWFLSRRFDFTDKSYKTALTSSIVAGSASAVVLFAIVALVDALVQPSNFAGGIGVLVYSVVPGVIAAVLIYFIALNPSSSNAKNFLE